VKIISHDSQRIYPINSNGQPEKIPSPIPYIINKELYDSSHEYLNGFKNEEKGKGDVFIEEERRKQLDFGREKIISKFVSEWENDIIPNWE
jgi:hypothetical protein